MNIYIMLVHNIGDCLQTYLDKLEKGMLKVSSRTKLSRSFVWINSTSSAFAHDRCNFGAGLRLWTNKLDSATSHLNKILTQWRRSL